MKYAFFDFVAKFPPVPMPVTLGEDTHHVFSTENEQLPLEMVEQFILPLDPDPHAGDEFTEYVPCFALEGTESFIALVWWKASLLNYEYVLCTFTDKGELISRQVIGFTKVEGEIIHRAVATIDEDWVIFIAEGRADAKFDRMSESGMRTYDLEIMSNGEIV